MTDDNDKPILTRRRVLGGMATVGAAGAAGAGSWAAFSDQDEVSATLSAGEIDGSVELSASYNGVQSADAVNLETNPENGADLALTDVKPGDYGSITFTINLDGNPAWVASCLDYSSGEGESRSENEIAAGDDDGSEGELEENLLLIPFYSRNGDNNFFDGDRDPDVTNYTGGTGEKWVSSREGIPDYDNLVPMTVEDAASVVSTDTMRWSNANEMKTQSAPEGTSLGDGCILLEGDIADDTGVDAQEVSPLQPGNTLHFGYDWHLPYNVGNEAQTDELTLKFGHQFNQVRHAEGPKMTNQFAPGNNTPSS